MARFSVTEFNNYIDVTQRVAVSNAIEAGMPSASALTAEDLRAGVLGATTIIMDTMLEAFRHLPSISGATATMFEIGSDEDNWFDIPLLEEYDPDRVGSGGGLVLPGGAPEGSGFQLVPIITGNGTQENPSSGVAVNSTPFDGVEEVFAGSGATANLFKIDYDGKWDVVASCKPAPSGNNQNNREVETDLWVFDAAGTPKRSIGFIASANQGSNGRTFTQSIPRSTLNQSFLGDDEWLGLVVRKYAGEGATTVTLQKAFIQVTLVGLGT